MVVQASPAFNIQFRASPQLSSGGSALCNSVNPGLGCKGGIQELPTANRRMPHRLAQCVACGGRGLFTDVIANK